MDWLSGWSVIGETHSPGFEPGQRSSTCTFFLLFFSFFQNLGIEGGGIDEPPLQLDEKLHKNGRGSLKNGGQKSVEESKI